MHIHNSFMWFTFNLQRRKTYSILLDPGKGVCADPVGRDATLGAGGPGPPVGAGERQLSPDRGGEKT